MFTLSDTLGQVSGEGEKLGMVCLSRVAPEDGLGALPHGLPAGQCFPIALAMRRARKQFIRLNDPWAGDPDGEDADGKGLDAPASRSSRCALFPLGGLIGLRPLCILRAGGRGSCPLGGGPEEPNLCLIWRMSMTEPSA